MKALIVAATVVAAVSYDTAALAFAVVAIGLLMATGDEEG